MSQHDMDIANATFPNTRIDLNLALKALASTSIGTTAPATPYDGQLWVDNSGTPYLIKQYVLATTTWVIIGIYNQVAGIGGGLTTALIRATTSTSEALVNSDHGKFVTFSNTSAVAVTLPQAGSSSGAVCPARWCVYVQNKNSGVVTITPTTSTINGAATLTLGKNQGGLIVSDGTNYDCFFGGAETIGQGTHTLAYGAGAWDPTTTLGGTRSKVEGSTYKINMPYFEFANSVTSHAQICVFMPKAWNGGTVTFRHWGYAGGGTGNALLNLKARAFASGDAFDGGDFGTAQSALTSSCSTTAPKRSALSSAITIANSPAGEKWVCFDLYRVAGSGADTLSGAYRMTQVEINIGINARNDE